MFLALGCLFCTILPQGGAHVRLTFPPARKYDLDFLDNVRTKEPCGGMPKGDIITSIPNGQDFTVTWHLGYPHKGGYKLELLNSRGQLMTVLADTTTASNFSTWGYEINDTISFEESVECKDCILKLTRQALEWTGSYQFMSCADIDIVKPSDYVNDCSDNGRLEGKSCICEAGFWGDRCQFTADCNVDSQCNHHGKCIKSANHILPLKECFCEIGYFGRYCEKTSPIKTMYYNKSDYNLEPLDDQTFLFLWRILGPNKDEMEGIIVAETTGFVAIGWRPDDLPLDCQSFPSGVEPPHTPKQLHGMDCQDIVVGKAVNDLSNVGDYYTRDRSTPRRDEFYGGVDDLTGAAGWENDGHTTIIFRKKINTGSVADHKFQSKLVLIHAYGHREDKFFKDDQLKYHGSNRGLTTMTQGGSGFASPLVTPIAPALMCLKAVFISLMY